MAKDKKAPKEDEKSSDTTTEADNDTDALDSDEETPQRSSKADSFWEKVGVEPIEIAMPKGVGLTLRAYRMSDVVEGEEEPEEDEDDKDSKAEKAKSKAAEDKKSKKSAKDDEEDEEDEDEESDKPKGKKDSKAKGKKKAKDDEEDDSDEEKDSASNDEDEDEDTDEKSEDDKPEPEEVPLFLAIDGSLPLFESAQALVDFVKSGAPTDLDAIDTWDELVKGIKVDYVVPSDDDTYELDLVVKNLRGGHDSWDPELMISAGELARDLGYALRLPTVMSTLAVGSPLDGLDNNLRSVVGGGLKAMFARRKVRKVGTQQTALAWRGIVNKINETVDWRN
ncbi:MAG: DNA primase [Stackebrandtia sp.]